VGDEGVGKSCLLLRYTDNTCPKDLSPTIGLEFRFKTI
jgi:GTPase SAR1 family protein